MCKSRVPLAGLDLQSDSCPLLFPSMCTHTLLSISRPGAFILSCYLLLHPPPSNAPPSCHYLSRPRKADIAGAEQRAAVGWAGVRAAWGGGGGGFRLQR